MAGTGPVGISGDSTTLYKEGVRGNLGPAKFTYGGIGVYGSANGGNTGVLGENDGEGFGVSALSKSGFGVLAYGGIVGLQASSSTGVPIYGDGGDENGTIAIEGQTSSTAYATPAIFASNGSISGAGGLFNGQFGVIAETNSASGYPLILDNHMGANVFYVSNAGDVYYTGTLHNFARSASGAKVTQYSAKTASPTLEDTGTAQLVNGAAVVRLDPTFAAAIETSVPYRVFVTPDGDLPHELFVAQKTTAGFVVREMQGGRSSVSFDYRVVATALGASGQRMSVANLASAPHIPLPSAHIPPRPAFPFPPPTR